MTVFGDRAFKGLLKTDELIKVGPNQKGMVPIGEGGEARQLSLDEWTEERPHENTARKENPLEVIPAGILGPES